MPQVSFADVSKVFAGQRVAVHGLSLELADGELLALVGPSGSGKTTILRLIAGLERPTSGQISIDGRPVDHLPPRRRNVAIAFQHHAVFPHLGVAENLAFGLRMRQAPAWWRFGERLLRPCAARAQESAVAQRVRDVAGMLGLAVELGRRPDELSGGQQQRVALGRAMIRGAGLMLLDEPLAHLDGPLRIELRTELRRWQRENRLTMVYVTHDPAEALAVGDRVAVLAGGRLQQVAVPEAICKWPANRFVAALVRPNLSFLTGRLHRLDSRDPSGAIFCSCFGPVPVDNTTPEAVKLYAGKPLALAFGPEDALLRRPDEPQEPGRAWLPARVETIEWDTAGRVALLEPRQGNGPRLRARLGPVAEVQPGMLVEVGADLSRAMWFDADSGSRLIDNNACGVQSQASLRIGC